MSPFENIVGALQKLSYEEKVKLRTLDNEFKAPTAAPPNGPQRAKQIIGLFADEPELMDQVMEAAEEQRAMPWRLDQPS